MQADTRKDFITVVSGLPRSGTSMMMRMLEAGGIPAFIDNDRLPDADNPNGYYEFEGTKTLEEDASWVANAVGHALKAIYLLLHQLPKEHRYKVVFMRRDLTEVIASQDTMLRRSGAPTGTMDKQILARHFATQLRQVDAWLKKQSHMSVLNVPYADVVKDPLATARSVAAFLGEPLDVDKMARSVEPALYRQRADAAGG